MANRRLWILPLSPWQHELGAWAASLILHSELQLSLAKTMGVQAIVFCRKGTLGGALCKPVGDMIWQWEVARFSKWADSNLKTWSCGVFLKVVNDWIAALTYFLSAFRTFPWHLYIHGRLFKPGENTCFWPAHDETKIKGVRNDGAPEGDFRESIFIFVLV